MIFQNCEIKSWLYLHNAAFEYGIQIYSGKYGDLKVWHCEGLKNMYLKGQGKIFEIDRITLEADSSLKVFCENLTIKEIDLSRTIFNKELSLIVSNSQIGSILFDQFINFGYISFTKITPLIGSKTKLIINDSNLGKTDFNNCNLDLFDVTFNNSRIDGVLFIGGKFSREISYYHEDDSEYLNTQKKLFNGQMKKSYENLGDISSSIDANADFMNAHLKVLQKNRKRLFSKESLEIFNIWLNKISSNHGQSTWQALLTLLIVSRSCFIVYCYSLGYYLTLNLSPVSWEEFYILTSYFLEFLNPIHRADYIPDSLEISSTTLSRIIEALSRIFISYFMYQFIQAFRKFGRR